MDVKWDPKGGKNGAQIDQKGCQREGAQQWCNKVDFYEILGVLLGTIFGSKIIQKGVPKTRPNWTSENEKVWVARFEKGAQKGAKMESQSEKNTS